MPCCGRDVFGDSSVIGDLRWLGSYGVVADVVAMNAALKAAKKPSSIHLYPQADHGFLADYRPSYNEAAARDGWSRALTHFKKYL